MFLRGCTDHRDQLSGPFELKKPLWPYNRVSVRKEFLMVINCMALAVWLGEDRKCSAAVVGLDLVLWSFMVNVVSSLLYIVDYSDYIESRR